jgi:hypothetical protein
MMLQAGKYMYHVHRIGCNLLAKVFFDVVNGGRLVHAALSL